MNPRVDFALNEIAEGRVTTPVSRETFTKEECEFLDRMLAFKKAGISVKLSRVGS